MTTKLRAFEAWCIRHRDGLWIGSLLSFGANVLLPMPALVGAPVVLLSIFLWFVGGE